MAYVLEKLSKMNDVRVLIKELVYMNQINYDKTFELFKQKEAYSNNIIRTNENKDNDKCRIVPERSIKTDKQKKNNNSNIVKSQVKIVSVEKVCLRPFNSQNNSSSSIKDRTINTSKAITTSSFYSSNKGNLSRSPNSLGKSFYSLGQRSNTKESNILNKKQKCLAFTNINKGSKDKKIIVLPRSIKPTTEYVNSEISNLKIKKNKTAFNQSLEKTIHNQYNNNVTCVKEHKYIEEKNISQRPASVIPLKSNSNKPKNITGLTSKKNILKNSKPKDFEPVIKNSNIPNIQLNVEINHHKPLSRKDNQSSRIINNSTTTSYPRTQQKNKMEEAQTSVNIKLTVNNHSIQKKQSQLGLKILNKNNQSNTNKGHQSKIDFTILKVVSNKEISSLIRSKTSMDKSNRCKVLNSMQAK